jgi:hypothetical protein
VGRILTSLGGAQQASKDEGEQEAKKS